MKDQITLSISSQGETFLIVKECPEVLEHSTGILSIRGCLEPLVQKMVEQLADEMSAEKPKMICEDGDGKSTWADGRGL